MFKKLSTFAACALLAATAFVSAPAHAAGNWYFINYCYSLVPWICPTPDIVYFGPHVSEAHCYAVRASVDASWPFNSYGRISTMCWEE